MKISGSTNIIKFSIYLFLFLVLITPVLSIAAPPLVPCTNTPDPASPTGQIPDADKCGFAAFMNLIGRVIRFILFDMAVPIAAIMFVYAGFMMVTSGGSTEQKSKAKRIFTSVVLGLAIAIAAWLIIETILHTLGYNGAWIGF